MWLVLHVACLAIELSSVLDGLNSSSISATVSAQTLVVPTTLLTEALVVEVSDKTAIGVSASYFYPTSTSTVGPEAAASRR